MAAATEAPTAAPDEGTNHGLRIFLPWLVLSLAADLIIYFVWGPHLPPGTMSTSAASQQFDIKVMAVMAAPVMALVSALMMRFIVSCASPEVQDSLNHCSNAPPW